MAYAMRGWLRAAAVTACLVLMMTVAHGQRATGTVTGSVHRGDSPIASARVVISSGAESAYTASMKTDQDGRFTVTGAPVGAISAKVYDATGKLIAQARGTLDRAGDTLTLDLRVP